MNIPWQRVPQQKTWVDSLTSAFNSSAQMFGTMKALSDQRAIQERYDTLGKALQDAGGDFNGVDPSLYSDAHGMQALGKLTNDWLQSSEGMRKVTENNRQSLIDRTNYLFAQMQTAEANQNNPEVFSGALTNAINGMGLPYKLSQREDGNFALSYMGPEGDRPLEKVYSPQDAYATIKSLALNRPQTARLLAQTDIALQLRNTEYQQDPNRWLAMYDDKTGNMMTVIPQFQRIQNKQGGMSIQPMYAVMQRGKPLQTVSQQDFMQQYGMPPQAFRDAYRMRQDAQNLALRQQRASGGGAGGRTVKIDKNTDKIFAQHLSFMNNNGERQVSPEAMLAVRTMCQNTGEDPYACLSVFQECVRQTKAKAEQQNINLSDEELLRETARNVLVKYQESQAGGGDKATQTPSGQLGGAMSTSGRGLTPAQRLLVDTAQGNTQKQNNNESRTIEDERLNSAQKRKLEKEKNNRFGSLGSIPSYYRP